MKKKLNMSPCPTNMQIGISVPIEDSDQPAHPHILIRVFDGCSVESQRSNISSGKKKKTDQTVDEKTDFESSLYAHTSLYHMLDT